MTLRQGNHSLVIGDMLMPANVKRRMAAIATAFASALLLAPFASFGGTHVRIAVPDSATAVEMSAAKELQDALKRMLGEAPGIVPESEIEKLNVEKLKSSLSTIQPFFVGATFP